MAHWIKFIIPLPFLAAGLLALTARIPVKKTDLNARLDND